MEIHENDQNQWKLIMSKNSLKELLLSKNGSYFSKRVLIKNLTKLGIIIVLYFYSSVVVLPENGKKMQWYIIYV